MRAIVIQQAATEGPGHLRAALEDAGFTLDVLHPYRSEALPKTLAGVDVFVVLGGPQQAWDTLTYPYLAAEHALLQEAVLTGRPTLAICLGAQLLAHGLGARVGRGPQPEIGLYPISLTDAGRASPVLHALDGCEMVHWHEDTYELPSGATHLARTAQYPQQAYSIARTLAVQFHPEVDLSIRTQWLIEGGRELAHVDRERFLDPAIDERHRRFAEAFVRSLDTR